MIVRWSLGSADENMSEDILTELAAVIGRHPWWRARARMAIALLKKMSIHPPARVLDAGCGWGLNLAALERSGYRPVGLDISWRCLQRLDRPGRELIEADLAQPFPAGAELYDAVLTLDVIEHLDDDRGAVQRLAQLVKPGGALVASVPALPELFSEFDEVQGHRRRYLPGTLQGAFAGSGLRIESILWWGWWMVPLLKRQRRRRRAATADSPSESYRRYLTLPPWPASWALRLAFLVDGVWTLRVPPKIGTSLFALARRPV